MLALLAVLAAAAAGGPAVREQRKPCQVYTPSWKLRDGFFGAGIYKVRVNAIDRTGERSRGVTEAIESGGE